MRSPETSARAVAPRAALIGKEVRDLAAGRAFWVLLVLLSALVGTGFDQAVSLYAEASRAAAETPLLARGLSPFDGILVPTFGALYLAATFLFPFVAIRTLGAEKQTGSLKLMLQMPYSLTAILAAKLAALLVAWCAMALIPVSALVAWRLLGGHVAPAELAVLLAGHLVYASAIAGIALVCAALADNSATAAILALAVTLGFWVLDFAAAGQGGLLQSLAGVSLTRVLRGFERGLLSTAPLFAALAASAGLAVIAGCWLHSGRTLAHKLGFTATVVACVAAAMFAAAQTATHIDMTEDRRNSFPPAETAALGQLAAPLDILVRLAPEDPRLVDFERGVLGRLRRTVPRLTVATESESRSGLFETNDEHYGEIVYRYAGREETSRSTGAGEVLPIIFELARVTPPSLASAPPYPGYPLVADAARARLWFYLVLPLLILAGWTRAAGMRTNWAKLFARMRQQSGDRS